MELIGHPSNSTMRTLRLPSPISSPSVSLGLDTMPISPFLCAFQGGDTYPLCSDCSGSVNPYWTEFSAGGVRLSCVPVLPHSVFDMFFDPGRIAPARLLRWFDIALTHLTIKASTFGAFEAQ